MAISQLIDTNAPRIFLDSSVIISGSASRKGASHAVLVLCEIGLLRPVVCPYVTDEAHYRPFHPCLNWRFTTIRSGHWYTRRLAT